MADTQMLKASRRYNHVVLTLSAQYWRVGSNKTREHITIQFINIKGHW